jgi:hypothetical protein
VKAKEYTTLNQEWKRDSKTEAIMSPPKEAEPPDQTLVFNNRAKDGSISAEITPVAGQLSEQFGYQFCECAFVFRFVDRDNFYFAGIGGFGAKFFIAKVSQAEYRLLSSQGYAKELAPGTKYWLSIAFLADRITLFHNQVPVLGAIDGTFSSGFCGLRTNRTEGSFENVDIIAARPKCFVIMPFSSELDYVYRVIKETVEGHDMDCVRADERLVSEPIVENVKNQIAGAEIVIVDFTGRNPNVYFEAGLADAWKKKWVVLAQSSDDLAFDVRHIRSITYSNKLGEDQKLKSNLSRALAELLVSPATGDAGSSSSGPIANLRQS